MRYTTLATTSILTLTFTGSILAGSYFNPSQNTLGYNTTPFVYTGIQLAYATTNYDKNWLTKIEDIDSVNSVDHKGAAGRFYLGYTLNDYLAGEMGYSLFSKVIFYGINETPNYRLSFTQQAFDLFAKGILHFNNRVGVYGKAGLAWVHRDKITEKDHFTRNQITPAGGLGISFNITPHIEAEASYHCYLAARDSKMVQFGGLGVGYKFF